MLLVVTLILMLIACAPKAAPTPQTRAVEKTPAPIIKASWEMEWESLIKAAKKEGQLAIYTGSGVETRQALGKAIKDKFDINIDWLPGRPPELTAKVLAENRAGLRVADIIISGSTVGYGLKPHNITEPLDKILLIPEVIDPSKWYEGKFPWWDKENMIITPLVNVTLIAARNTELVGEKEIISYRDLLNPKWKGKISMTSPLIGGAGLGAFGMVGEYIMGWDYIRELAKQEPAVIADARLPVEWLARGKQAIAWAARSEPMKEFQDAGAPIKFVTLKEGGYSTDAGTGFIKLKDSPHRAASVVFINWLLTSEGQTVFSRARGFESNRLDVPKDHVDPMRVRMPDVKYYTQDEIARALEDEWILKAKEILGHLMR